MGYTKKAVATRARIIDSATAIILNKGYAHTKLDEVLLASNVRKGNFYYYFKSKDELCLAVLKEKIKPMTLAWFNAVLAPDASTADTFANMPERLAAMPEASERGGNPLAGLFVEMSSNGDDFRAVFMETIAEMSKAARAFIEAKTGALVNELKVDDLAAYLVSLIEGAVLHHKIHRDSERLASTIRIGLGVFG